MNRLPKAEKKNHEVAFELFKGSGGNLSNADIAAQLNVSPDTVRKWKSRYKWVQKLNENAACDSSKSVTKNKSVTKQSISARAKQKKRILDALETAGIYSPSLDFLINLYLDAYEEYQENRTDKLRKEMARYLKELGLNNNVKPKRSMGNQEQNEPIQPIQGQKSENKLLQFRRKFAK